MIMGTNKMTSVENVNERGLDNNLILDNTKLDCQKPNCGCNIINETLTWKNHIANTISRNIGMMITKLKFVVPRFTILYEPYLILIAEFLSGKIV